MGYPAELFEVDANFLSMILCPICGGVLQEPVSCPCGRSYCQQCLAGKTECPVNHELLPPACNRNLTIDGIIQKLHVRCKHSNPPKKGLKRTANGIVKLEVIPPSPSSSSSSSASSSSTSSSASSASSSAVSSSSSSSSSLSSSSASLSSSSTCPWSGPLSQYHTHLDTQCQFEPAPCKHAHRGCHVTVPRGQLPAHESQCPFRQLPCPLCLQLMYMNDFPKHICTEQPVSCDKCGKQGIARRALPIHALMECEEAEVPCELATLGCTAKVKRRLLEEHEREYAGRHMTLALKKIADQQKRIEQLEKSDTEKQTRLKWLEEEVKESCRIVWSFNCDEVKSKLTKRPSAKTKTSMLTGDSRSGLGRDWLMYLQTDVAAKDWIGVYLHLKSACFAPDLICQIDMIVVDPWKLANEAMQFTHKFKGDDAIGVGEYIKYDKFVHAKGGWVSIEVTITLMYDTV